MFVAALVIGLVAASAWARRIAIRGMAAATAETAAEVPTIDGGTLLHPHARVTRLAKRAPRAATRHTRRAEEADEIVPIPQWQRDP